MYTRTDYYPYRSVPVLYPLAGPLKPVADAILLRNALTGDKIDTDVIIEILAKRTFAERWCIAYAYNSGDPKTLIKDLKTKLTHGNFRNTVIALLTETTAFYAKELHNSIKVIRECHDAGTDDAVGINKELLIEILATISNYGAIELNQEYVRFYGKTIDDDVVTTDLIFQNFIRSLLLGVRQECDGVYEEIIDYDRDLLVHYKNNASEWKETLFRLLANRSYRHIGMSFCRYGMTKLFWKGFEPELRKLLTILLECCVHKNEYFANSLRMNINSKNFTRIIVGRSEIDLGLIKSAFNKKYNMNLETHITNCIIDGPYRKLLLAIITGN